MLQDRNELKAKTIAHAEKLTRTELRKKRADQLRQTREEFSARFAHEEAKHHGELATWIAAERMYLDVLLDRNLDKAAEMCWKVLDARPTKVAENPDDAAVLRGVGCPAAEPLPDDADGPYGPQVGAAGIGAADNCVPRPEYRAGTGGESENQQWKLLKFSLLVALDKPKDLETAINDWITAGDADNRWRVALGYLLAEEGNLKEAIARFEAVAAADELGPAEWRTLADWYQAVNRRADYERAKVEIYKTADEGRLFQWTSAQTQPWLNNAGQLPTHLDDEVVLAFRQLLSKSANPQVYVGYPLQNLYGATRDFRLLLCLADSIPGHTAGQIYPYLQSVRTLIDDIREEATVDSVVERIVELRKSYNGRSIAAPSTLSR